MKSPRMCYHAMERFREHHPEATRDEAQSYFKYGEEISPKAMRVMYFRGTGDSTYILSPDRKGVFVLDNWAGVIITYLRLSALIQGWCRNQWPMAA